MRQRSIYILALMLVGGITVYEELYLRKILFARHFTVLAGSLPNFLAVVIFSIGYMAVRPQDSAKARSVIWSIVVGLILYELAQLWIPDMIFDFKDVAATILGGVFSYILKVYVTTSR